MIINTTAVINIPFTVTCKQRSVHERLYQPFDNMIGWHILPDEGVDRIRRMNFMQKNKELIK
jgi:hypothetical protein